MTRRAAMQLTPPSGVAAAKPRAAVDPRGRGEGDLLRVARRRVLLLALSSVAVTLVLVGRLAWLTVVEGERLTARADRARLSVEVERAPRGRILDRRGRVLAQDRPTEHLAVTIGDLDRGPDVTSRVARWVREPRAAVEARWDAIASAAAHEPDGPPLALWTAPSAASRRMFARLVAAEPGLLLDGDELLCERELLLQPGRVLARLAWIAGLDLERAARTVAQARARALAIENRLDRQQALATPVRLREHVPFDVACSVLEEAPFLPGVVVQRDATRHYPLGPVAGHVVGYQGPLSPEEARALRSERKLLNAFDGGKDLDGALRAREGGAFLDDRVGRQGVERAYEVPLAGEVGVRLVERDRQTGAWTRRAEVPTAPGVDVTLWLDAALQEEVEGILDEAVEQVGALGGAIVLLDAQSGAVYAMASSPRYDPGRLGQDFPQLAIDPRRPLVHRAVAAALPPGSTVKAITALGAIERAVPWGVGPVTLASEVYCRGYLHSWKRFKCNAVHHQVGLEAALAQSCNIYFYRAGEGLGEAGLTYAFDLFGLGRPTGVDLPGESAGLIGSGAWKRERAERAEAAARVARARADAAAAAIGGDGHAEEAARLASRAARAEERAKTLRADAPWRKGDSRNAAIGQGTLAATPLQVARVACALQNGGALVEPRLAQPLAGERSGPPTWLDLDAAVLAAARRGMRQAVTSARGTARRSILEKRGSLEREALAYFLAHAFAKTGTAEAPPKGSHAWMLAFTDTDAAAGLPPLGIAVVLEHVAHGVHGGDGAGPPAVRALFAARRHLGGEGAP